MNPQQTLQADFRRQFGRFYIGKGDVDIEHGTSDVLASDDVEEWIIRRSVSEQKALLERLRGVIVDELHIYRDLSQPPHVCPGSNAFGSIIIGIDAELEKLKTLEGQDE